MRKLFSHALRFIDFAFFFSMTIGDLAIVRIEFMSRVKSQFYIVVAPVAILVKVRIVFTNFCFSLTLRRS